MEYNKYKVLLSNTAVFAVGNILVKLIAFVLMPLYTSVLTTKEYGISELLNSTTEIIIPLATVCIIEALYRFSIDKNADYKSLFSNSFRIIIVGDLVVFVGCIISKVVFAYEYAFYFCGLYMCTTFYKMTTQFARGLGHVKRYAFYGVLNALILVLCNVIFLVKLHGGIGAYLSSFTIAYGIAGGVAFLISKEYRYFSLKKGDTQQLRKMLKYSIPSIPNMISWWINSVSDRYILMLFWNAGVVGLYTAASKLPAMINLVSSIFQQAWQYSTAKEIESEDKTSFFSTVLRGYLYICVCSCGCLILFNKVICRLLLKTEFYNAWKFVPLLLLAAMFGCISTYFGVFYQALKKNTMLMVSTIVGAIINILFNLILIPIYGGFGAAIATTISYIVVTIIRIVDVSKKVYLNIQWWRVFLQIVMVIIMMIFEMFIQIKEMFILRIICLLIIILSDYKLIKKLLNLLKSRR